jgi:hypothetical protein
MSKVVNAVRAVRYKHYARFRSNPEGNVNKHRAQRKALASSYRRKRATPEGRAALKAQVKKYI